MDRDEETIYKVVYTTEVAEEKILERSVAKLYSEFSLSCLSLPTQAVL